MMQLRSPGARVNVRICSKIDEFCSKSHGFCIENDGFCVKNDEFRKDGAAPERLAAIRFV